MSKIPEWTPSDIILGADGYPSDEELETIRTWPINCGADLTAVFKYVHQRWNWPDWGWKREARRRREWKGGRLHRRYSISTGGWSGNESLIAAMEANWMLWTMTWQSSKRGGHYEFSIDEEMK